MNLLEKMICQSKDVETAQMGNEVGMIHIETGKYFVLSEVGADIWKKIENPILVKELIDKMVDEYDIEYDQCESDVVAFVELLGNKKLVIIE